MVGPAKLSGLTLAVGLGVAVTTGHGVATAETPEGGGSDPGVSSAPPAQTSEAPGRPTRNGPMRDRLRLTMNRPVPQRFSVRSTADADKPATPVAEPDSADGQGTRTPSVTSSSTPARGRKPVTATAVSTLPRFTRPVIERRSESRPEASPQLQRQMQTVNPTAATSSEPVAAVAALAPSPAPVPVARPAARIVSSLLTLVGVRPGVSTPAPGVPTTPIGRILELFAAARRQIGQRLFNHTPTASVTSSENKDTGVVTGTVATDADGDPLTSTLVSGKEPAHGTVVFDAKGGYVYTPDPTWAHTTGGADQFTVTVSDEGPGAPFHLHLLSATGHTVTVPVSIVVTPINHVPTVDAKLIGAGIYQVTTHDDDAGDVVTVVATADAAKGAVKDNGDGTFTFTPDAAYAHSLYGKTIPAGADQATLTFTGTDPYGAQATDVVTATITPVNNAPTVSAVREGVDANGGVVYRITKGDKDAGDAVTVVATTDDTRGSVVDNKDGTFTFTANAKYAHDLYGMTIEPGADEATITFTAKDQFGATGSTTAVETITPVNHPPQVMAVLDPTAGPNTYRVTATDVDPGDVPTVVATTDPQRGSVVDNQDGTFTFVANPGYAHSLTAGTVNIPATWATIIFTARDPFGADGISTVIETITPVNHDPTLSTSTKLNADGTTSVTLTAGDGDNDGVIVNIPTTTGGRFDASPGVFAMAAGSSATFTYSPDPGSVAQTVSFVAVDGHGGTSNVATVTLAGAPNQPPTVTVSAPTTKADGSGAQVYTVTTSDPEGNTVTVDKPADTADIRFTLSGGVLTATPTTDYLQSLTKGAQVTQNFQLTASDGQGNTVTTPFGVTITGVNHGPSVAGELTLDPDTSITTGTFTFSDVDGDPLTSKVTFAPIASSLGTATATQDGNTWTIRFAPNATARAAAANGGPTSVLLTYTVSDGTIGAGATTEIDILPLQTATGSDPGDPPVLIPPRTKPLPPPIPDLPPRGGGGGAVTM